MSESQPPSAPSSRRAAREARNEQAVSAPTPTPQQPQVPAQPVPAPRAPEDASVVNADVVSADSRQSRLEQLYAEEERAVRVKRRRPKRGLWITLIIVLVLGGGLAYGVNYLWTTYEPQVRELMGWTEPKDYDEGLANGEAVITISSGDTGETISTSLYEAGVTKTSDAFYSYLIETEQNPTFFPGVYRLQKQMTSAAALEALEDPANKADHSALLREGLTLDQSLTTLSESLGIPLADFEAAAANPAAFGVAADSLDGWLFPALYEFRPEATATEVLQTLVNRTVKALDEHGVAAEDRQRILTIASIIEREARQTEDFYRVSRVIQNRLNIDMKLQMDSTAQFGYGELHDGTVSSSAEALEDDNPWNTYVITGLPVGPISNPGDLAIDAALNPAEGDWLYFVTVNLETGQTVFTNNYEDHLAASDDWRAWCTEHPDAGC